MAEPTPAEAVTEAAKKERKQRKRATVLISIPGWPSQEPGRPMIWAIKTSAMKAAKEVKRMKEMMPEYEWSREMLSYTDARKIKLKPFNTRAHFRKVRELKGDKSS